MQYQKDVGARLGAPVTVSTVGRFRAVLPITRCTSIGRADALERHFRARSAATALPGAGVLTRICRRCVSPRRRETSFDPAPVAGYRGRPRIRSHASLRLRERPGCGRPPVWTTPPEPDLGHGRRLQTLRTAPTHKASTKNASLTAQNAELGGG